MTEIFTQSLSALPKPNYEYITKADDARRALNEIINHPVVEFDTEATDLDPFLAKISLAQIGIPGKSFVFDVRGDTEHSDFDINLLRPVLENQNILKLLQNAVFDMKLIKAKADFYVQNIYDTMLVEQLINLGRMGVRVGLKNLVERYLYIDMPKEPGGTFKDYNQVFQKFQLDYAANDVSVLSLIRDLQWPTVQQEGLVDAAQLEFGFTVPMCEMELNGVLLDVHRQRAMLEDIERERNENYKIVSQALAKGSAQKTMFGVALINLDSPIQLRKALAKHGISLESTSVDALAKFKGHPIVDALLAYRKVQKLASTYGEALIEKIHPETGRIHTDFKQMVSTGRMSSSNPNLQNIPNAQKYRTAFIAPEGYSLITSDMSGAELRILANLSQDQIFVHSYQHGVDLHTRAASEVFGVPYEKVSKSQRKASKAIQFGLCYGLSEFGLAKRLGITKKEAQKMINTYFDKYRGIKTFLDKSASEAVTNGFSRSISGRKRYYDVPEWNNPDRDRIVASIKRRAKNAPIQGSNADTIKQAMIYCVDRLKGYDARLILTVHDEIVVEAKDEIREEVAEIVRGSLIDGFGKYFNLIPMETDALTGPCWLKNECDEDKGGCGSTNMAFIKDMKYGTRLVCANCGKDQ
jgi:DNA polymerase-1